MAKVYLSTGSNQGDRLKSLIKAAKLIDSQVGNLAAFSGVVESEPWGFKAEMDFYNQVLLIETNLTPLQTIKKILDIEKLIGRTRAGDECSSRVIDIDILFYGELHISENNLKIPHPKLHERKFVLQPISEIEPNLVHPLLGKTVMELLILLEDKKELVTVINSVAFEKYLRN